MKPESPAAIWMATVFLTSIIILSLAAYERSSQSTREPEDVVERGRELIFEKKPQVLALGSSLFRNAIPVDQSELNDGSLLGDGRTHYRLAVSSIDESETLALLEIGIEAGVATILLEANPLWTENRIKHARGRFDFQLANSFASVVSSSKLGLRLLARREDRTPERVIARPRNLDNGFRASAVRLRALYPSILRQPRNLSKLRSLLESAGRENLKVILVVPPWSATRAEHSGTLRDQRRVLHFRDSAESLGLPLFVEQSWPDKYFTDQSHLNRRGRDRFVRRLATWYGALQ